MHIWKPSKLCIISCTYRRQRMSSSPKTHSRKHLRQLSMCMLVAHFTMKCPKASSIVIGPKRCSREKSCLVKCIWEMLYWSHPLLEGHLAGWHNKGSGRKTLACSGKRLFHLFQVSVVPTYAFTFVCLQHLLIFCIYSVLYCILGVIFLGEERLGWDRKRKGHCRPSLEET